MATEFDNNNTGALFKNNKDGNEKRPDYSGSAEVDGVQYYVSAWVRKTFDERPYMKLIFKKKEG